MTRGARGAQGTHRAPRGFTLVEVCVAVAIMAIASAVMVPALNNMGRAELRRASRQLGASVRRCFDEAALSGQTYRMVFTLGPPPAGNKDEGPVEPIAIEASELTLSFTGHDGALTEASDPNGQDDLGNSPYGENFGAGADADAAPLAGDSGTNANPASAAGEMFRSMFGINKLAREAGRPSFEPAGNVRLPAGVRVSDVWIDGMHEASSDGSIALVFFPTGYTQHARLHLQDEDGDIFTLEVEPLTGRVRINEGYLTGERGEGP